METIDHPDEHYRRLDGLRRMLEAELHQICAEIELCRTNGHSIIEKERQANVLISRINTINLILN